MRFANDFKQLSEGELDNWYDDSDGVLAILIMYQFFAKFMFRGDKRAYLFESDAVHLSRFIVEQTDFHKLYTDYQMLLVVSPLGFAEDPELNLLAITHVTEKIEHYRSLGKGVPRYEQHISMMQEYVDEFKAHHELISPFGRDPRRNAILGRTNTPQEDEYLLSFQAGDV